MAVRRRRVLWFRFRDKQRKLWKVFLVYKLVGNQGNLSGETDFNNRIVRIKYTNNHAEMVVTMWHEWLHVACGMIDPDNKEHDLLYFSEESAIRRAEYGLAAIAKGMGFVLPEIPDEASLLAA